MNIKSLPSAPTSLRASITSNAPLDILDVLFDVLCSALRPTVHLLLQPLGAPLQLLACRRNGQQGVMCLFIAAVSHAQPSADDQACRYICSNVPRRPPLSRCHRTNGMMKLMIVKLQDPSTAHPYCYTWHSVAITCILAIFTFGPLPYSAARSHM
jgi:hypothetical protein